MFKWEDPPEGGKEHTELWKVFVEAAKTGKIENLPQGTVHSESRLFFLISTSFDFINLRADGELFEETPVNFTDLGLDEELVEENEPSLVMIGSKNIIFEIETDFKRAIGKLALYSLENMDKNIIKSIYIITKKTKKWDNNKFRKLRKWLSKIENIGNFKIRWFIINLNKKKMYELRDEGLISV